MFRPVARAAVRTASNASHQSLRRIPARRWASTGADKPRSWKSGFARWGLAGAIVYYYNTSSVFADEPAEAYTHNPPPSITEAEEPRTLESYAKKPAPSPALSSEQTPIAADGTPAASGGASDLEAEAASQGAFNEETGEINWDCPCLGGMAHGPCGEEFRAAFSCFVFSQEEPKGVDCIEKFKGMQDCFRAHPDIYGSELEDEEQEGFEDRLSEGEGAPALARDGGEGASLGKAADNAKEAAVEANEEVKVKAASVKDDIKKDAEKVKTNVEEKLQEKRDEAKEGQEKVREVARDALVPTPPKTKRTES